MTRSGACPHPSEAAVCQQCAIERRAEERAKARTDGSVGETVVDENVGYEEVIVRVASWDDDLTVYHTDADCVCLNSARGVERRAKRFLPEHVEACPHCEGTVADGHRDPDRSHFEALRAAADGGRDD